MSEFLQHHRKVENQARAMLALASSRHSEFPPAPKADPGEVVDRWKGEVLIEYVASLNGSDVDDYVTVDDNIEAGLLGLFSLALEEGERSRIQVQFTDGEYTARRNFTLMHELGHYLQQTDDDLARPFETIASPAESKRLEEDSCNRFASFSLLPESYVRDAMRGKSVNAAAVNRVFEQGRPSRSKMMRASRPVVARRMADFLQNSGTVTLVKDGELNVRAYSDGRADYEGDLTSVEREILDHAGSELKPGESCFYQLAADDGTPLRASVVMSRGWSKYHFIVIERETVPAASAPRTDSEPEASASQNAMPEQTPGIADQHRSETHEDDYEGDREDDHKEDEGSQRMNAYGIIDNRTSLVKDDLVRTIRSGDRMSVAASLFSMYAYRELRDQLESLDSFRFLFTSKAFTKDRTPKERREFYIPRLGREQSLYGTNLEIRLRNELTQKAVALECVDWIRRKGARFMSFDEETGFPQFLAVERDGGDASGYMPFNEFSTTQLGVTKHASSPAYTSFVMKQDATQTSGLLTMFDQAWNSSQVHDVTEAVIDGIERMYRENPPELVYYKALYRIFSEFLEDVDEDVLPKEGTGFRESCIWHMLYDFQKDAAVSIINKLETYNGCILADSVGLGKTFTALAVIKYFESRNRNVLVLCPKKLKDNWVTYRSNATNNPIAEDRLRYDVLYHTDLSRSKGDTIMNIPIERINWGGYDLVVIDESHNFRNGNDSAVKADSKENRYVKLLDKVIHSGVRTKVLMLSATPVNNRFRDLENQLRLAYEGNDDDWTAKLDLSTDIDNVFKNAQKAYSAWSKLEPKERTTANLMDRLDFDFFKVLDQVTVARSRKHIQRYYDMKAIGRFPERLKPISVRPKLSTQAGAVTYDQIYDELDKLFLALYMPSEFILESRRAKYFEGEGESLTTSGRETGVRKLMATNLLKRFESSVHSFRLTLERVLGYMKGTVEVLDRYEEYRRQHRDTSMFKDIDADSFDAGFDFDQDDDEQMEFTTQGKKQFALSDMNWKDWRRYIQADITVINELLKMIGGIDAGHDAKLQQLYHTIRAKVEHPINPGNRKLLVFTAFADTADYLYEHVSAYAKTLGMETAEVTGARPGRCTLKKVGGDMSNILACFSPISKERETTTKGLDDQNIDIVIATDCISEGQNLQDCDEMVNYDIHWNPVRIVQRFGRVDRIGSKNERIQLVNYWPDVDLDKYLKLKDRVEARMRLTVLTSTGDDDYINENEKGDLAYRASQLKQMQNEIPDLEDVEGGISITDLGLNEFRMDLVAYHQQNPDIEHTPDGIDAVVEGDEPGIMFVLKNVNEGVNTSGSNRLHPYYLVHVGSDGTILHGHLEPKACLDLMRMLCKGKNEPDDHACRIYNRMTKNGKDMSRASRLLQEAVSGIIKADSQSAADSFLTTGMADFLAPTVQGIDDFELICFLVILPKRNPRSESKQ
ncbi:MULTISPECIES: helicase-related protein [unclassified Bifidobacterium]|uniref:helicase-related protein n=1 Tax=unclassified Bifidobacterium TaxID=2608897 RepID=UPI00112DE3D2|nr:MULTISPECIES: helicase-related protein [unclassified Bifidobacterium]TPF77652.1 helicase [Bifidobacterium sp. UTCIF-1]TPF79950.1 helicase [Bifidobacterium sp. UTCIF-24]TPF81794.1 helicase [Bifidobacterium sp. UTCIF-3]TPF83683.1 helicase [Bifidobacterium sp. UTCIF-36]TPF88668.1 helicase [Bifidobacterium sp. UTBIF-56]